MAHSAGTANKSKSILICFAHPDDEIGCGPLVTYLVRSGARATLICATNGDVGTVDEKFLRDYPSITALRLAELDCATKAIGFTEVNTFGYRDSGMMGSADNQEPSCLWQAPLEEVTDRVVAVMRRVAPQVIITFNTYGAYGHPDHIKINHATVAAFQRLQSEPEHPQKLYYTTESGGLARLVLALMKLLRRDPRTVGRNRDVDLPAAVDALTPITTRIRVSGKYVAPTLAAARCHASQLQSSGPAALFQTLGARLFLRTLSLSRIFPAARARDTTERDIFAAQPEALRG
jgi:LmbE family N-acetylglucosaminyl deacetylase